jgi:hypothetical protein
MKAVHRGAPVWHGDTGERAPPAILTARSPRQSTRTKSAIFQTCGLLLKQLRRRCPAYELAPIAPGEHRELF